VILDHHRDRRLVQAHVDRGDPSHRTVDGIAKPEFSPQRLSQITVIVAECGHGSFRSVRKRRERTRGRDRAVVALAFGLVRRVPPWIIARGEPPRMLAIPPVFVGVRDRVSQIDARDGPIVIEVAGPAIGELPRVETEERIVSEEQRTAGTDAHGQRDAMISVAVAVAIALRRLAPAAAVPYCPVRLTRPAGVIQAGRYAVRGRRDRE
jgi:hypothetical protein